MNESLGARELSTAEALRLLSGVRFGRVVFTRHDMPTIRPVNHIVHNGTIVIPANASALTGARQIVAFEADTIDHVTQTGWCVIVRGTAEEVTSREEIARMRLLLHSAIPGPRDRMVRIHPDIITGVEYLRSPEQSAYRFTPARSTADR
ncbi:pyridoxamine 5'-phosphate oxidase family protein [Nocardia sp. NPDC020380]|uniref:pyridoxamine 5'-phosphate oxidase family protein n=1 Tax=Nocardia sp. NPDC020380 TaxID=3364309 RepID=UPI0037A96C61